MSEPKWVVQLVKPSLEKKLDAPVRAEDAGSMQDDMPKKRSTR
jgi:hypothetical protein